MYHGSCFAISIYRMLEAPRIHLLQTARFVRGFLGTITKYHTNTNFGKQKVLLTDISTQIV